jgi:Zn-dependent protease
MASVEGGVWVGWRSAFCALSAVVSLAAYAWFFGMPFALGLLGLLFAHELGHLVAMRAVGLKAVGPVFVPFLGAVISLSREPINARMAANVAIGGPAAGTLSAFVCLILYLWTDSSLMFVLTYTACLLNLFNLLPCSPLDGGRIATAVSPHFGWLGIGTVGLLFVKTGNFIVLAVLLFSLLQSWQDSKERQDTYYTCLSLEQRLVVGGWYLALLLLLSLAFCYLLSVVREG